VLSMRSLTQRWVLFKSAHSSVHPEPTSVTVRVWQNWPFAFAPQWLTVSSSKKPGRFPSLSKQTRIGIWLLRSVQGFVVCMPLRRHLFF
jgi:hypothetical protein